MLQKDIKFIEVHIKKIQISESDLYEIIKQVLLEQEKKKEVTFTASLFEKFISSSKSNQFIHKLNSEYEKVIVNDFLDLFNTPITSLPDNLVVKNSLFLGETPIEFLPDNLHVVGNLYLYNCKNLMSLPENLHVGGDFNLQNTNIKKLPSRINLYKSLYLDGSPIEYLEDYIVIQGDLTLSECKNLKLLPHGLVVESDLDIQKTNIETLPDNLEVKKEIYIFGTPLSENHFLVKEYLNKGYNIVLDEENFEWG
jgi:hypothetical protein